MGTYLHVSLNAENHKHYRMIRHVLMKLIRILPQKLHTAHDTPDGSKYSNVKCTFHPWHSDIMHSPFVNVTISVAVWPSPGHARIHTHFIFIPL
jgi:hypothetical protein